MTLSDSSLAEDKRRETVRMLVESAPDGVDIERLLAGSLSGPASEPARRRSMSTPSGADSTSIRTVSRRLSSARLLSLNVIPPCSRPDRHQRPRPYPPYHG